MKGSGKGSRKLPGDLIRTTTAALIVTVISVILGAGPAMATDDTSTPPGTAAGQALAARILADHALTIEILVVLVGVALMFSYSHHHRRSGNRPRSAHARTRRSHAHSRVSVITPIAAYSAAADRAGGITRLAGAGDPWMAPPPRQHAAPPRPAASQPMHADDYPSWPGRPGPYALHPDHPSWPGRPDPRWAATETMLQADGYPGWPAPHSPPWRDAEPPAAVLPARARADLALRAEPVPRADTAPGTVVTPGPAPVRQEGAAGVIDWVRPERVQVWDAGSVELATWIISEANQQAADIRHEARDQMSASLADARQEAADLVRRASEQATATLAAAEMEAAEMRAAVTQLSTELGGVATYVTENLLGLAPPTVRPVARPVPEPVARPGIRPRAKPGSRSASRQKGSPRQLVAIRVAAVATAALVLFVLVAGTTEVALHGFRFFVFRSVGSGETGPGGLQEDQGPGQPDAPGAHKDPHKQ